MSEVWVVAEHDGRDLHEVTLEMLLEAGRLASKLLGEVCAVLVGHRVGGLIGPLAHYGARKVYLVEDERLSKRRLTRRIRAWRRLERGNRELVEATLAAVVAVEASIKDPRYD